MYNREYYTWNDNEQNDIINDTLSLDYQTIYPLSFQKQLEI